MDMLILVLALMVLVGASVWFGADSRPTDDSRATRWFPAEPAD